MMSIHFGRVVSLKKAVAIGVGAAATGFGAGVVLGRKSVAWEMTALDDSDLKAALEASAKKAEAKAKKAEKK